MRINNSLLVNPSNAFQVTNIKRVLTKEVSRMFGLNLVRICLPMTLSGLKRYELGLSIYNTFFSSFFLKGNKSLLKCFQAISEPKAPYATTGYQDTIFSKLV